MIEATPNPSRPRWPGKLWLANAIGAAVLMGLAVTLWVRSVFLSERLSCFVSDPSVMLTSGHQRVGIQFTYRPPNAPPPAFVRANVLRHDIDPSMTSQPKPWFIWVNYSNKLFGGWIPWPLPVAGLAVLSGVSWRRYCHTKQLANEPRFDVVLPATSNP